MEEKKIIINDILINYYFINKNSSNNLIFLHGWRSESSIWFPIMKRFSEKNYNTFSIDLPGFGKSDTPNNPFGSKEYADIIKQLIQKLSLENTTLIGHSHGGRTALKLAIDNNNLLKALVLVDSSGIKTESKNIKSLLANIVKPFFKFSFTKNLRKKIYKFIGSDDYLETPQLKQTFLKLISEDLSIDIKKISIPTLILWGDKDYDTPLKVAKIINKNIKGSILSVINNAGHYSFIDKPLKFEKILTNFLKTNYN